MDHNNKNLAHMLHVQIVFLFALSGIGLSICFSIIYYKMGLDVVGNVLVFSIVVALISILYLKRTYHAELVAHILLILLFIILLTANNQFGGFDNPNFSWFLVIPLAGGVLLKHYSSWLYTLLILGIILIYYSMKVSGQDFPNPLTPQEFDFVTMSNRIGSLVTIAFLMILTRYEHRAKEKNLELKETQIFEIANFDNLTSLSNRSLFASNFEQMISQRKDNKVALLFVDLDAFKSVNDSYGHGVGDELLVQVGKRFRELLSQDDLICRQGGDEFLIVPIDRKPNQINKLCTSIIQKMSEPFILSNCVAHIGCSIGVAYYPIHGNTYDQLISAADIAMYRAKTLGGAQFKVFHQDYAKEASYKTLLSHKLRQAINLDDLELYYQPKFSVTCNKIIGYEALIRWHDGETFVEPEAFVRVAEEFSIISQLGSWVLHNAFSQLRTWLDEKKDFQSLAINISAMQVLRADFISELSDMCQYYDVPASMIELELTESIFIDYTEQTLKKLEFLSDMGFKLVIDDYGTGYASIGYLRRFPVHALKIDKDFVKDIVSNDADRNIVASTIDLAHKLGIKMIAEGVENEQQIELLKKMGCETMQGFYFGKPQPAYKLDL
ncbi:MAG: bifunctional diguanylate cyclase/phosphodiesterase [Kangiellaceae bacterium]|nr:bifunctional diguanylate cyclase/phosphodiesterase [Kangiellaceae bacterium]